MRVSGSNIGFKEQSSICKTVVNQPVFDKFAKISAVNNENQSIDKKPMLPTIIASGIVAFGAIILTVVNLKKTGKVIKEEALPIKQFPEYIKNLASGLEKHLGKKVEPESLSCVMTKDELLAALPNFKKENYVASTVNIKRGVFKADLHSHSNFSDGNADVKTILTQAAEYGDKLNSINNEKFIFALTDHDCVDGVIEALKIISENPEKYKNIRFVPGCELSFAYIAPKSSNPCEVAETLAYGINPFSENMQKFFNNIHQKRNNMINGFFEDLKNTFPEETFSKEEMQKFYQLYMRNNLVMMNTHWQLKNYAQTKKAISDFAKSQNKNVDKLYNEIMSKVYKNSTLWDLKCEGLIPYETIENTQADKIRQKYSAYVKEGKIIAPAENTYEEIIDAISKEDESFLALAHPFYLAYNLNTPSVFIKALIGKSKGLLKASESYHQAYSISVTPTSIDWINKITKDENLLSLGGRDNHKIDFLKTD